jgi:hypothetical protein
MNVETPRLIVQAVHCGRTIRAILARVFPSQRPLPEDQMRLVRRLDQQARAA